MTKSRETQSTITTMFNVNALKEARHETSILYVMDSLFTQIPFAFFSAHVCTSPTPAKQP